MSQGAIELPKTAGPTGVPRFPGLRSGSAVLITLLVAVLTIAGCTRTHGRAAVGATPRAPSSRVASPAPSDPATATAAVVSSTTVSPPAAPARLPVASTATALAWSPSRVPTKVVAAAKQLTDASVAEVANGTAWLAGASVWSTPIDVSAADPARYAAAMPAAAALARVLQDGAVVLSADEARLRRTTVGDRLRLGGKSFRVVLTVPDAVIGYAEMFVTAADGVRLGLPPDRYLLIRPAQPSAWASELAALRRADPVKVPLRLVAPGKARALREADAVLSPLEEKLRFGEFRAVEQSTHGGDLTLDPAWVSAHISTASVPILGRVTCNRAFLPALRESLAAVVTAGLQRLIDPGDFGGCFNGRLIAGQPGTPISHHAYGSAIDLNVRANPDGAVPQQDPRLVRIFAHYGLTWGGSWLVPDGMHFEALSQS